MGDIPQKVPEDLNMEVVGNTGVFLPFGFTKVKISLRGTLSFNFLCGHPLF